MSDCGKYPYEGPIINDATPRTNAIAHRGFQLDALAARSIDLCRELERENAALLDVLESMANQHCHTGVAHRDYNGQLAGTLVTDSGALTANGKALHLLAKVNPPRFRIVAEAGRMVIGYWPENDPEKHPRTNPVSQ
jgi:hypothetical protein